MHPQRGIQRLCWPSKTEGHCGPEPAEEQPAGCAVGKHGHCTARDGCRAPQPQQLSRSQAAARRARRGPPGPECCTSPPRWAWTRARSQRRARPAPRAAPPAPAACACRSPAPAGLRAGGGASGGSTVAAAAELWLWWRVQEAPAGRLRMKAAREPAVALVRASATRCLASAGAKAARTGVRHEWTKHAAHQARASRCTAAPGCPR